MSQELLGSGGTEDRAKMTDFKARLSGQEHPACFAEGGGFPGELGSEDDQQWALPAPLAALGSWMALCGAFGDVSLSSRTLV